MQFSLVRLFKSLNARPKMFSGGGENGGKVGRDRFSFENSSSRHFPRDNTKFLRSGETGRREREEIRGTIWQRASLAWFRSTFDYPRRRWRSVPRKKDKGRGRTCTFLPLPSSFFLFFFLPFFLPFFFPPLPFIGDICRQRKWTTLASRAQFLKLPIKLTLHRHNVCAETNANRCWIRS